MGKKARNKRSKRTDNNRQDHPSGGNVASCIVPIARRAVPSAVPVQSQAQIDEINSLISDNLLDTILSRGVEERLNSKQSLRKYFASLLALGSTHLQGLIIALLKGLEHNSSHNINARISVFPGQEEPFPLLIWVCQWRLLQAGTDWKAGDELVEMVLKAGANVNDLLENETNALFFAVKYGSPKTVDLLLEADIRMIQQKDKFGHSCLFSALEYPSPSILGKLLDHLPVTELLITKYVDGDRPASSLTAADKIVSLLVQPKPIISWHNLGEPTASDIIESLMLVLQRGARFSTEGSSLGLIYLGHLFASDVNLNTSMMNGISQFKELAKTLVGAKLSETFRSPLIQDEEAIDAFENLVINDAGEGIITCPICLDPVQKKVTLYCGHPFCRRCIIDYGQTENGKACPMCRRQLCLELHDQRQGPQQTRMTMEQIMGLADPISANRGPQFMLDEQVDAETRFQGIYSRFSSYSNLRSKLVNQYNHGHEEEISMEMAYRRTSSAGPARSSDIVKVTVDLAAGVSITNGSSANICPRNGPVSIQVSVRNIPILARISNRSLYTIVSKTVADNLGLKRIERLRSSKFVHTVSGEKLKETTFTCLEPFTIQVGDIEVTLRTAIEASPDPMGIMFGMQLGLDFLCSGIWCPIDIKVGEGDDKFMRVDGDVAWSSQNPTKEMLRYYSRDGRVANIPILHFSPFDQHIIHGISLKANVTFEQCYWCCRVFPKGMKVCRPCHESGDTVTYCDQRCQTAAWKVHKKRMNTTHQEDE